MRRGDYRTGYTVLTQAQEIGRARGYDYEAAWLQHMFALAAQHWIEPLENVTAQARQARDVLLQSGDLQYACFSYHAEIIAQLDCAPTLDVLAGILVEASAFSERTGNVTSNRVHRGYKYLLDVLRGDCELDSPPVEGDVNTPTFSLVRAHAAALFGKTEAHRLYASAAMPLMGSIIGFYPTALAYLLHALAIADQARGGPMHERETMLAELDRCRDWLALRADDAPRNFSHLVKWIDAERAWAKGNASDAASLFDESLLMVRSNRRPWHRALLTERAGLYYLTNKLQHIGSSLLADAQRLYGAWGATAKVKALRQDHAFLRNTNELARYASGARHAGGMSADNIDLLAVLRASQALSSETSLVQLQVRVRTLLGALTGATTIHLLTQQDDVEKWFLSAEGGDGFVNLTIDEAVQRGMVPATVCRYMERTREILVLEDALQDERFARDPYFSAYPHCSVLAVPIFTQGAMHAMLLLENRATRGAFSGDRLDTVMLIAGQLTVSLNNANLYASLERKVSDRTAELEAANRRLLELSMTDGLTGVANRRRFDEALKAEWARGIRQQTPVGLIMIDIDHFKPYNDHYGHQTGDLCLKRVASVLAQGLRKGVDLTARYGGEEFVIILPGADMAATLQVAERARTSVLALTEPHHLNPQGIVTVSLGVASVLPSSGYDAIELIRNADSALYIAKKKGRNQVAAA